MKRWMGWMALCLLLVGGAARGEGNLLEPGDAFPPWALADHTGAEVKSSDLAGQSYLLWFYPKAGTPGCTTEGQALRDAAPEFAKAGVVILGVSFDSPKANAGFVADEKFPFRLLSDADRKLALAVGAATSPSQWWARRISYLVGPDGKVRRAYASVDPARHAAEVLRDAAAPAAP